jgi:UDP-glucose 4-epimerase
MQVLVTGAAGFLGAALANTLVAQGHQVIALDNMSTSSPNELSPNIHFTRGDVNDRPKLWTLLQDVDCVYHLAARVLVPESVLYPAEYNLVNTGGTVNLMEAVRDAGVRRVVFISSGAIYGNQEAQPLTEEALPNPKSPYAVSKLAAEYYVRTIGQQAGIESVCLRVFNAYGPGQQIPPSYTPVIPSFLKQALQKGTIVVHGSGGQTRDYVYVDDVVQAMITAGIAPDIDGEIINVGSGIETSILDLVSVVSELAGFEPEVIYNPRRGSGPTRMCASLQKAERLLGYQPRISLREGLQRTMQLDTHLRTNGQNHH